VNEECGDGQGAGSKTILKRGKFNCNRTNKARAEDKKFHVKTMMHKKAERTLKQKPNMYRFDRTRRKENTGRTQKWYDVSNE
jgi:hypothetical protein